MIIIIIMYIFLAQRHPMPDVVLVIYIHCPSFRVFILKNNPPIRKEYVIGRSKGPCFPMLVQTLEKVPLQSLPKVTLYKIR